MTKAAPESAALPLSYFDLINIPKPGKPQPLRGLVYPA